MHIITGMHRSGTSFVSQVFHELGADFGPTELLFPADTWNQKGYFENTQIVDVNNRLILGDRARLEYWLDAPEHGIARAINSFRSRKWKYFLFPSASRIAQRGPRHDREIAELHQTYRGIFVKDPRFCLTLPIWANRGPLERVVFSFRNPGAVAASIRKREGLHRAFGYRYWLYHVRNFARNLPAETDVFFIDFDSFFNPETQGPAFARIMRFLGQAPEVGTLPAVAQKLDPNLRNHVLDLQNAPQDTVLAYRALKCLHDISSARPVRLADHPAERSALTGD